MINCNKGIWLEGAKTDQNIEERERRRGETYSNYDSTMYVNLPYRRNISNQWGENRL